MLILGLKGLIKQHYMYVYVKINLSCSFSFN